MTLDDEIIENKLGASYLEHKIFQTLKDFATFYKNLSFHIMDWSTSGTTSLLNIDTYVYSSMHGTIESIYDTLIKGRINDSYSLLRKFYDSTVINIYSNLYLEENCNIENLIVTEINEWLHGKKRLPDYRIMSQYIRKSNKLQGISKLLIADDSYKKIRDRCNDHTHYNYYRNLMLNDNTINLTNRLSTLDRFENDLEAIFIQHFAFLFSLKGHYMMASDYRDCLEMGIEPDEHSEYFVAAFIQKVFDNIIKVKRPDIAAEIKSMTLMQLD